MKNKTIVSLLVFIVLFGCKKEEPRALSIKDDIDNLFDLTKYKKILQKKINDSVMIFEGKNKRFSIKGQYNFVSNYKIGWWKSYDITNKEKYLDIEFFKEIDKTKEFNNQIIFYKNNIIDTLYSKFYTKKMRDDETLLYSFYFPKSWDKFYSTNINIGIISNERPLLYPTDFKSEKIKEGCYTHLLNLSKYKNHKDLNIIGLFSEYSINEKEKKISISEIFINDTIKLK